MKDVIERKIELTEDISITIKSSLVQDVATANAEAILIQKITKVIDGITSVSDMMKDDSEVVDTRKNVKLSLSDDEAKELVNDYFNADKHGKLSLMLKCNYSNIYTFKSRMYGLRKKYDLGKAKSNRIKTRKEWASVEKTNEIKTRRTWSDKEVKRLVSMNKKGVSFDDMAVRFGRPKRSIFDKIYLLKQKGVIKNAKKESYR